ncbi:MAG: DUF4190 domain-containing protein [Salinivirgaceae bacterium]|nr:DUF4190 domain-containing protein [Salinivirgaceae bacterium]
MEAKENKNGNSSGIVSLVCGILALFLAFVPCVGVLAIPFEAVAIVFGIISIIKASENKSAVGMAVAGLVTAIVALILSVAWIVVIGRGVSEARGNTDNLINNFKNNFEWRFETEDAVFESTDSTMARLGAILDSMNNPASVHLDMRANDTIVKMSITDEDGKQVKMDIATRKNK